MQLNHINLTVQDVDKVEAFLVRYFELTPLDTSRKNIQILQDDAGMIIAIMKGRSPVYPPNFHVGFIQPSREKVDEINARMVADGLKVDPPTEEHGWTFYVDVPGGFSVEVLC